MIILILAFYQFLSKYILYVGQSENIDGLDLVIVLYNFKLNQSMLIKYIKLCQLSYILLYHIAMYLISAILYHN